MALQDYSLSPPDGAGPIVRGGAWPPAGDPCTVKIQNIGGWVADAEDWDWWMEISRTRRGGTPDLLVPAESALLVGDTMFLTFRLSAADTAALPIGPRRFCVEILSQAGGTTTAPGDTTYDPNPYNCVAGTVEVRDFAGEG